MFIQSGSGGPSLLIGGRVMSDVASLKTLPFRVTETAGTLNCTPRLSNGTAGYQVPVGKQFRIVAARIDVFTVSGNGGFNIAYADNDMGFSTNNAPVNRVDYAGDANSTPLGSETIGIVEASIDFVVPAGKYIGIFGNGVNAGNGQLFGYEENA